jgi:hypothetical protein
MPPLPALWTEPLMVQPDLGGGADLEEYKDVGRREPAANEMTEIPPEVDVPPPIGARLGGHCPP